MNISPERNEKVVACEEFHTHSPPSFSRYEMEEQSSEVAVHFQEATITEGMRATIFLLSAFLCCFCNADVQEHAAAWLTKLGDWIQGKKPVVITELKVHVDKVSVRFHNVKEIIPIYCNDMSTIEYTGHRLKRELVKTACEWLRDTTAKFLIEFGHKDLSNTDFPVGKTRIVYKEVSITYHQVEWTIPWVCSERAQLPFEETEIEVIKATCVFLYRKVKTLLEELRPLAGATSEQFDHAMASDEHKREIVEKTKPYVQHVCKRVQNDRINGAVPEDMVQDIVDMGRMLIPNKDH